MALPPAAAVLGGWEQLASKLLASPCPSQPASHPLSPSQRRLPLPLGSAPRCGCAPAPAAQACWLLGPLSWAGHLVSGKSKLPPAEHCHSAYQCKELLSLVGRLCALPTDPPTPGCVCSKYNGEVGSTLKRGVRGVGMLLWLRLAWGAPQVTAVD